MRIPSLLMAGSAMLVLFAACNKHNTTSGPSITDYTKFTPGNYWIYESYEVDSNGVGAPGSQGGGNILYDSVYVEKDTAIGQHTYHKLMKPDDQGSGYYTAYYYRDSLGYEVDQYGFIGFGPFDRITTFRSITRGQTYATADSASRIEWTTGDVDKVVTVPAGTFTTTARVATFTFYPFAASHTPVNYRRQYTRYAPGVGMVSETLPFYAYYPTYTERRLLRYHVQ